MKTISHFIDGKKRSTPLEEHLPVINPAVNQPIARMANASKQTLDLAVCAGQSAFKDWSSRPAQERAQYLLTLAELIESQGEILAELESLNTGKPVALARTIDIPRAAQNFRFFAQACTQFHSECHTMAHQAFNYTRRDPLGTVGCIAPWNLPLYLLSWKIAPALAAGNCVIAKPSEVTPLTADALADLCQQAQLPPGVLNIVYGTGSSVGAQLCAHPDIKAISFTGGTQTGRSVAISTAQNFKKVSLELGGKNPAIVFSDCDLEKTVKQLVKACFSNQGQICLCPSRLLIQSELYEAFKEAFLKEVSSLTIGDPFTEVSLGSVISPTHHEKILNHIKEAKNLGGTVLCGGHALQPEGACAKGFFIAPTVIEGLPMTSVTNQEEIFGPIVTLCPFDSLEEAIDLANMSNYGLAATVCTQNIATAHQLSDALAFGIVWVNCWMLRDLRTPFGGVKQSGLGREGGVEALRFFTEPKNVCVDYS